MAKEDKGKVVKRINEILTVCYIFGILMTRPVQPSTAQYSLVLPSTAHFRQVHPSTAQYSPVTPY